MRLMLKLIPVIIAALSAASVHAAAPLPGDAAKFFETQVRPLLADNCFGCHGEKKHKNDLRLDARETILSGGKSGPAITPGDADKSLLIKAINQTDPDLKMPPAPKHKLSDGQIATLTRWVQMGAPWPATEGAKPQRRPGVITDEDRAWWSFVPVREPAVPAVDDGGWSKNPIDKFIFAKLKAEGLTPAPAADRATLLRRVYFDLIGVPPTVEEVNAFIADKSAGAFDTVVEKLLGDPRYGERWARHWLDLVRYAESDGYRQDAYRPTAWRYRDYVIRSFNADKPYNRFVMEQLAGDEMNVDDADAIIGTGFLRHGVYEYNQRDAKGQWTIIINEMTDVTGEVFLGLSMGCARCHNHKFDPILQADYFRLQSFFAPFVWKDDLVAANSKQKAQYAAKLKVWEEKTAGIRARLDEIEKGPLASAQHSAVKKFPDDVQAMWNKPVAERNAYERQICDLVERQVIIEQDKSDSKLKGAQRDEWVNLKRDLAKFDDIKPDDLPTCIGAVDAMPTAPAVTIPGDRTKRAMDPLFLTILGAEQPKITPIAAKNSSGRRLALAQWITRPDNPLTTRVIVNRIWQHHFGRGIVATPSDMGRLGEAPTHPELLDWLTAQFLKEGWSFKQMHRLILSSATYQQAALRSPPEVAKLKDPDNHWLWRFHTRRLDAEQIRDAMLTATGELDPKMGGASVNQVETRRSIYIKAIRNTREPLLDVFDGADGFLPTAQRNVTTTASQALLMINGQWPLQRAEAMAARIKATKPKDPAATVDAAYRLVYGRLPETIEREAAIAFLKAGQKAATDVAASNMPVLQTMSHRGTQAALIRDGDPADQFRVDDNPLMPTGDFTIEAYVQLSSLYPSAAVRVIASQWAGKDKPGWSLGVTSEKSAYQPRNFILELIGDPKKDAGGYQVIASDIRPELNKPYYLAAVVHVSPKAEERKVTFYVRDLSDPDLPMRSSTVKHKITGFHHTDGAPLDLGGRGDRGWDGLLDEVRLSRSALAAEQLLINDGSSSQSIVGHWTFEQEPGVMKDASTNGLDLGRMGAKGAPRPTSGGDAALIDLCHVLLNSNEFVYVD